MKVKITCSVLLMCLHEGLPQMVSSINWKLKMVKTSGHDSTFSVKAIKKSLMHCCPSSKARIWLFGFLLILSLSSAMMISLILVGFSPPSDDLEKLRSSVPRGDWS